MQYIYYISTLYLSHYYLVGYDIYYRLGTNMYCFPYLSFPNGIFKNCCYLVFSSSLYNKYIDGGYFTT